ncbi:MAG: response regulator, partial [Candidatus Desulfatibia sp.]|uniref:response regulator n=1 Tax=Candidatus Desulfatibia sp. TaxID=3101189 RepID=UPI002F2D6D34
MDKVLVVDDDPSIRKTLIRNLRRPGYTVLEAENGKEALEVVYNERPDVIVLDVMMPVMDGTTFCRILRSEPVNTLIYVIMLTGRAGGAVQGLDIGA